MMRKWVVLLVLLILAACGGKEPPVEEPNIRTASEIVCLGTVESGPHHEPRASSYATWWYVIGEGGRVFKALFSATIVYPEGSSPKVGDPFCRTYQKEDKYPHYVFIGTSPDVLEGAAIELRN